MGVFKSFISLILLLALFSCSKEITQQNDKSNDVSFTELGSDAPYLYGETYQGRKGYVTYYPGNIPVILSIPHGGDISPPEIGNRSYGVTVTDSNTIELGMAIRNYFYSNYNIRPYVIINNLKRTKLDANREINEAAQGNIFARRAFNEFHFYTLNKYELTFAVCSRLLSLQNNLNQNNQTKGEARA